MEPDELLEISKKAAENSYSPYSRFRVGAAILCADGSVVSGANVENRSFGLTNCAERTAVFSAVASGKRDFLAIAITCLDADSPVSPCGACRQVISEFMSPDGPVYFQDAGGNIVKTTVGGLFPYDALHDLADRRESREGS